jgi:hypothetical protein
MGDTYYLHQGKTKTGKPRYFFAKTICEGAITEMPEGFEVSESVNAVVSVRRKRKDGAQVPAADLEVVRETMQRLGHLRDCVVRADGKAIVIYQPYPRREQLEGRDFGFGRRLPASYIEDRMKKAQLSPVMKFEREGDEYAVYRMTYRGEGGWSYPLGAGTLGALVKKYVRHIGTDEFFELM